MSILRLALNSIAGLSTDIYSAVTSVTEAIRKKKYLTAITTRGAALCEHTLARVTPAPD